MVQKLSFHISLSAEVPLETIMASWEIMEWLFLRAKMSSL